MENMNMVCMGLIVAILIISILSLIKIEKNACKCGNNTHMVRGGIPQCIFTGQVPPNGDANYCCANIDKRLPFVPLNPNGTCP